MHTTSYIIQTKYGNGITTCEMINGKIEVKLIEPFKILDKEIRSVLVSEDSLKIKKLGCQRLG